MIDHYTLIQQLTEQHPSADHSRRLNDFAFELGWRPSDRLDIPASKPFTTAHLKVEHGLEYSALITFIRHPARFSDLTYTQRHLLFGSSYNSLVDWHINVDHEGVAFVYNRYNPPEFHIVREPLSRVNSAALQRSTFEKLARKHPMPDVPALDRALIETISLWKQQLGGLFAGISNTDLSCLFNAIIFIRAAEDHIRLHGQVDNVPPSLLDFCLNGNAEPLSAHAVVTRALEANSWDYPPSDLLDLTALRAFDTLDTHLLTELIGDFYRNRYARFYEYDFSLISKHALSRIYEHYVSVLRVPDTKQLTLLPRMAAEDFDKSFGAIYTPEYIARFFARYVRNQLPLARFNQLRILDPACGSGIFLRAFLELQNDALLDARTTASISRTFANVTGVDIDPNACQATRLSLSLLSLVLLDQQIATDIRNQDAVSFFSDSVDSTCFDVVVANPPYVKVESQDTTMRQRVSDFLGDRAHGRSDLYLAILAGAIDQLNPGGYGLFVLPETFLKADSARALRRYLTARCWIRCIVDLTAVRVFEDVGVYTILLIFQKHIDTVPPPRASVVRCGDKVAQALQDVLDDRPVETPFYSLHHCDQRAFETEDWSLESPRVHFMLRKYSELSQLDSEADLRQGMNTGADRVFIVDQDLVQGLDPCLFRPLLTDREMEAFTVPANVRSQVFYPYLGKDLITESVLLAEHRGTWDFLETHRESLEKRSAVKNGTLPWWRPERPRSPGDMFRQKIVVPHVVIAPKFSMDATGRYAISRSPIILSRLPGSRGADHLLFLLGVLNSSACFWHITQRAHTFDRGYSRLESSRLRGTRIPSFIRSDKGAVNRIVRIVNARLEARGVDAFRLEEELDELVSDLYGLSSRERSIARGGAAVVDDL